MHGVHEPNETDQVKNTFSGQPPPHGVREEIPALVFVGIIELDHNYAVGRYRAKLFRIGRASEVVPAIDEDAAIGPSRETRNFPCSLRVGN